MIPKLLSICGEAHLKSCSAHTNAERNVPDLSRRATGTEKGFAERSGHETIE
jgi:hypothetical protein